MIAFALNQDAKNADWTLTTPERATAAQAQADQLTQQGETYKAPHCCATLQCTASQHVGGITQSQSGQCTGWCTVRTCRTTETRS